ncbi:Bax inhibitor-1/YccA family protein [Oceanidesulfovibrio marinus]|uniref:Bax inhibitor-1/YccA family protein n=1 Tax=Oceanidesulfovibrio marinus TaxID=370038 RepID=A0ABX6N9Z9_9BACT|nr:Bax inhibitor-1/YccA family protein [Oceanidesulfovibrio marinus]QJT07411.1 Bax inhibitor-1/YccA family protein [Oceanidesulfovibrio marinus]
MPYNDSVASRVGARAEVVNAFMRGVYFWMSLGLLVTGGVAWYVAHSEAVLSLFVTPQGGISGLFIGLIIAEFLLVIALSAAISRISATAATAMFMVYSALNGVTISFIFLIYTQASIVSTFLICAAMFGAMSLYGLMTKKDLTSMGSFMFMGLIGIIIAMVVNIFLQSTVLDMVVSVIGVIVFTGLTAYDTQQLRVMGETVPEGDATAVRRGTIIGALRLYLDFINLFLMLLRLFGDRR